MCRSVTSFPYPRPPKKSLKLQCMAFKETNIKIEVDFCLKIRNAIGSNFREFLTTHTGSNVPKGKQNLLLIHEAMRKANMSFMMSCDGGHEFIYYSVPTKK